MPQKAIVMNEIGVPVVATTRSIPEPTPGTVVVKITAAGLNPHDQKSRDSGLFVQDKLPVILANDVAGEVVKLGPSEAGRYKVGDHIFAQSNLMGGLDHGGLQEYCLLDTTYSSKIPSNVTDDKAANVPINCLAPFVTFFTPGGFGWPIPGTEGSRSFDYKRQMLLVIGGGAGAGKYGIQFAKWAGIGKIIVVAGNRNEAELKKYGATDVIDRHSKDLLAEIRKLTGDDLLQVYDCINEGPDLTLAAQALSNSKKGTVACLIPGEPDPTKVGEKKEGFECRHQLGYSWAHPEACGFFWKHMEGWLANGTIAPLEVETFEGLDADKVNAVYDNYRDGKAQAKVVIRP